eukprot:TRINITY_DN8333_c0_g1_i1.p1 TRINITY_DN8333_c0_g1~~TRINITY_DN8333_c0_g1_i1.p1  ORF type:complete len:661 (+),score=77.86 TRINITY_DN8333_c0_g1_i1:138-2120(+)
MDRDSSRWEDEKKRRPREDHDLRRSPPRRDERERVEPRGSAQKRDRDYGSHDVADKRGHEESPPRKRTKTDDLDQPNRRARESPERGPAHLSRRFLSENFLTFKEFSRSLNIDSKWPELPSMYEEYRRAYDDDRAREMHILWRQENWYRDLYLPTNVEKQFLSRTERAKLQSQLFFNSIHAGELDVYLNADRNHLILPMDMRKIVDQNAQQNGADTQQILAATTPDSGEVSGNTTQAAEVAPTEGIAEVQTHSAVPDTEQTKQPTPKESSTLLLKQIPKWISREQLEKHLANISPFQRLIVSNPNPARDFSRTGWVEYASHDEAKGALASLHGQKITSQNLSYDIQVAFHIQRTFDDTYGRTEVVPAVFSDADRMVIDLAQSRRLMETLDKEKGIYGNPLADPSQSTGGQLQQTLDRIILYLKRVHLFDYYRGQEYMTEDSMILHAGLNVLRGVPGLAPKYFGNPTSLCDARVNKRIDHFMTLADLSPNTQLERVVGEKYTQHSTQLEAEKSRCDKCQKLFKGADFIKKHLINRHAEVFGAHIEEEQFFQNYLADPNKLTASAFSLARAEREIAKARKDKGHDKQQTPSRGGAGKPRQTRDERNSSVSAGVVPVPSPVSPATGRSSISYSDLDAVPAKKVGLVYRRRQPVQNAPNPGETQ